MKFDFILEKLKTYSLAIVCFTIGLVCVVVLYLRSGTVDELSARETTLRSELRAIKENVKNSRNLEEHVSEMEILVEEIDSRLFREEERAVNLNFFYELEEDQDVSYGSLDQQPEGNPIYRKGGARQLKKYSTMAFRISLQEPFEKVLRFMHTLETSRPLIRVGSFNIRDADGESDPDQTNATMRISILAEKN
jgi:hypothetical protein